MNQPFDVLIIGGGIVGLTAALAMATRNYKVALIDAGTMHVDTRCTDSRVYAINAASEALLQQLNIWQLLDTNRLSPYRQMHVWDAVNGAHIDFDCRQIATNHLGTIVEESLLKQALLQQIAKTNHISLFPNCSVDAVHNTTSGVSISSQDCTWEGQLLMIADGAQSPTRNKLKVPLTTWSYNQNALVTTVQTEKPHQQTAYQVFNPDGPLAFLPLSTPNQCSIVWSTTALKIQHLMALDENAFNQALDKAFAHHLGQTQVISARHQFPLHMRHATQYTGPSWMLLGDAAHTIHPLAGLGLNVGLEDVRVWINNIDTIKGKLNSTKRLSAYQRERKNAVWQIIMLMEGLKRIFGPAPTPLSLLRGWGLSTCNALVPLKRLLIKQACGSID